MREPSLIKEYLHLVRKDFFRGLDQAGTGNWRERDVWGLTEGKEVRLFEGTPLQSGREKKEKRGRFPHCSVEGRRTSPNWTKGDDEIQNRMGKI